MCNLSPRARRFEVRSRARIQSSGRGITAVIRNSDEREFASDLGFGSHLGCSVYPDTQQVRRAEQFNVSTG